MCVMFMKHYRQRELKKHTLTKKSTWSFTVFFFNFWLKFLCLACKCISLRTGMYFCVFRCTRWTAQDVSSGSNLLYQQHGGEARQPECQRDRGTDQKGRQVPADDFEHSPNKLSLWVCFIFVSKCIVTQKSDICLLCFSQVGFLFAAAGPSFATSAPTADSKWVCEWIGVCVCVLCDKGTPDWVL